MGNSEFEMNEEIYRRRGNSFGSWRAPQNSCVNTLIEKNNHFEVKNARNLPPFSNIQKQEENLNRSADAQALT